MPNNLKKRTSAQRKKDVATLSLLTLTELRKRQRLVEKQRVRGFKMYVAALEKGDKAAEKKAIQIAKNCDEQAMDLHNAVDIRSFGKKKK